MRNRPVTWSLLPPPWRHESASAQKGAGVIIQVEPRAEQGCRNHGNWATHHPQRDPKNDGGQESLSEALHYANIIYA